MHLRIVAVLFRSTILIEHQIGHGLLWQARTEKKGHDTVISLFRLSIERTLRLAGDSNWHIRCQVVDYFRTLTYVWLMSNVQARDPWTRRALSSLIAC